MKCNGTNGNGVQSIISLTVPSVGLVVSGVCGIPRPQVQAIRIEVGTIRPQVGSGNNNRKVYTHGGCANLVCVCVCVIVLEIYIFGRRLINNM